MYDCLGSSYTRVSRLVGSAPPCSGTSALPRQACPVAGCVVLALLTVLLIWLGVYPSPLLALIETMTAGLL